MAQYSLDAVQGNEQKHKTYWNRVWEYFNKKTFTSTRNANSPMNRWSTIQLQTNKFVGILASIEMVNPSGVNEQNKIIKAKEAYLKVQAVPFKFDHCWNILRHQPKWLELVAKPQKSQTIRRSTATSSPSTL
uniref:No apical meristem-associated C-terminal domain-containing protein n=1 Tax=Quercus lobata TaxID=97700 RepID=A0A7N2LZW6_QUELO